MRSSVCKRLTQANNAQQHSNDEQVKRDLLTRGSDRGPESAAVTGTFSPRVRPERVADATRSRLVRATKRYPFILLPRNGCERVCP